VTVALVILPNRQAPVLKSQVLDETLYAHTEPGKHSSNACGLSPQAVTGSTESCGLVERASGWGGRGMQ